MSIAHYNFVGFQLFQRSFQHNFVEIIENISTTPIDSEIIEPFELVSLHMKVQ